MGKVKLLLDVIEGMRSLADSLQAVSDAMAGSDAETEEPTTARKQGETVKSAKTSGKREMGKKGTKPAVKAEPEEQPLTLEEVRAVLAEKSRAGHTAEVKALLTKHGADKLSDIDPAEYPALLADAEVL